MELSFWESIYFCTLFTTAIQPERLNCINSTHTHWGENILIKNAKSSSISFISGQNLVNNAKRRAESKQRATTAKIKLAIASLIIKNTKIRPMTSEEKLESLKRMKKPKRFLEYFEKSLRQLAGGSRQREYKSYRRTVGKRDNLENKETWNLPDKRTSQKERFANYCWPVVWTIIKGQTTFHESQHLESILIKSSQVAKEHILELCKQ